MILHTLLSTLVAVLCPELEDIEHLSFTLVISGFLFSLYGGRPFNLHNIAVI